MAETVKELSKRFWLFGFDYYYPEGGLEDVMGCFDSVSEAKLFLDEDAKTHSYSVDVWYILDTLTMEIVLKKP